MQQARQHTAERTEEKRRVGTLRSALRSAGLRDLQPRLGGRGIIFDAVKHLTTLPYDIQVTAAAGEKDSGTVK